MGISYEGYGLNRNPDGWMGYNPRKPRNQLRFNFMPTIKSGNNFSMPVNFNFAALATNFAGPFAGVSKQNIGQWLTNPLNNFGFESEIQMGRTAVGNTVP